MNDFSVFGDICFVMSEGVPKIWKRQLSLYLMDGKDALEFLGWPMKYIREMSREDFKLLRNCLLNRPEYLEYQRNGRSGGIPIPIYLGASVSMVRELAESVEVE